MNTTKNAQQTIIATVYRPVGPDHAPPSSAQASPVWRAHANGDEADPDTLAHAPARAAEFDTAARLPLEALRSDLRSDHAGESGAVMIYRGILAVTRDAGVSHFAQRHLATEAAHLAQIESLLAPQHRSRLLPLWRVAGWLTGALPAWFGPRAVYATIEAVETFVDQHYAEQIESIDRHDPGHSRPPWQALRALLQACRSDEIAHRDEAAALLAVGGGPPSLALRAWAGAVGAGSRVAVKICRRF